MHSINTVYVSRTKTLYVVDNIFHGKPMFMILKRDSSIQI